MRTRLGSVGFTLVEIIASMTLLSALALTLLAALRHIRESADQAVCVSNLRQWGLALNLYANDNDFFTPRRGQGIQPVEQVDRMDDWFNALPPYLSLPSYSEQVRTGNPARPGDKSVFVCPSAADSGKYRHFICYGMNMYLSYTRRPLPHRLVDLPQLSQLAFMADAPGGWASTVPSSESYSVQPRHQGFANVVFADGHVQTFPGDYLGCGKGEPTRSDVRWNTLVPSDDFRDLP